MVGIRRQRSSEQGSAGGRIALWALLIVLFVTLHQFVQSHEPHPRPVPPESSSSLPSLGWLGLLFVVFSGAVGLIMLVNRRNHQGLKLLEMGKRADALAVFERASRFLVCSGATRYNAALCLLLLGKQEDAQRRFDKLSKSWVLSKNVPLAAAAAHLASVSASLSGDEPKARALFDQANKIKAETPVASVSELMLLARAGNHGGVVKLAETRWQALESCGWILRKAARLVQAYAAQQIGQPEAAITEIIAGAKPFAAGDFDFLSAQWPEMKAFLETRTAPSPSAQSAAS